MATFPRPGHRHVPLSLGEGPRWSARPGGVSPGSPHPPLPHRQPVSPLLALCQGLSPDEPGGSLGKGGGRCWKNCSHPSISREHWTQRNPQMGQDTEERYMCLYRQNVEMDRAPIHSGTDKQNAALPCPHDGVFFGHKKG